MRGRGRLHGGLFIGNSQRQDRRRSDARCPKDCLLADVPFHHRRSEGLLYPAGLLVQLDDDEVDPLITQILGDETASDTESGNNDVVLHPLKPQL